MIKKIQILLCIFSVFCIFVMALNSNFNAHPDEDSHLAVVQFYSNQWSIPKVGELNSIFTYNEFYGRSYINLLGLEYYILGKLTSFFDRSQDNYYLIVRIFIALFYSICLLYVFFKNKNTGYLFYMLIFSPQVLYIFSYINNDYFAYLISAIICIQIINPTSYMNNYIKFSRKNSGKFLLFPLSVSLLFLSKYNYLPFMIFIFFYIMLQNKHNYRRVLILFLISISLFSLRFGYDIYLNGLNKGKKIELLANELGKPGFRPIDKNTYIPEKKTYLNLKDNGTSYLELFSIFNWHKSTFNSFFGKYGYMNIHSLSEHSLIFSITSFLLLISLLPRISFDKIPIVALFISLTVFMIFISTMHSWINDFQPQGKYLFPIIPMYFLTIHGLKIKNKYFNGLLMFQALFSIYSFYINAIQSMAKF